MSYRTKVNGIQIFGNNESSVKWIEFIKSQGIEVNTELGYKGEIKDFMKALEVIEEITIDMYRAREENRKNNKKENLPSLFDLTSVVEEYLVEKEEGFYVGLTESLIEVTNCWYCFLPYQFYKACESCIEVDKERSNEDEEHMRFKKYKIKNGKRIIVEAN